MTKPEWFPWDDDVTNSNGWYGRKEMDAYLESLEKALKIALELIGSNPFEWDDEDMAMFKTFRQLIAGDNK